MSSNCCCSPKHRQEVDFKISPRTRGCGVCKFHKIFTEISTMKCSESETAHPRCCVCLTGCSVFASVCNLSSSSLIQLDNGLHNGCAPGCYVVGAHLRHLTYADDIERFVNGAGAFVARASHQRSTTPLTLLQSIRSSLVLGLNPHGVSSRCSARPAQSGNHHSSAVRCASVLAWLACLSTPISMHLVTPHREIRCNFSWQPQTKHELF
jgi:hypothetical protein